MVAYSFKQQFVASILSGAKRQTIRADRKRHAREGEALQLYTGMRTRQCALIGRAVCEATLPVRLDFVRSKIELAGENLTDPRELDAFARIDGFDYWYDLFAFWKENHAETRLFSGVVIRWNEFRPAP